MDTCAGNTAGSSGILNQGEAAPGARARNAAASPSAISFTVPGVAVPWARAGGGKTVVRFTPPKQRHFMTTIKMIAAAQMRGRPLMDGAIELSLMAIYPWPKSWPAKRRAAPGAQWKTSRPDGGNLQKIIEDAMNTVVWVDDAQVASWHGWKLFGDVPRVVVKIRTLGGEDGAGNRELR